MRNWSLKLYTSRATFSNAKAALDIRVITKVEGLEMMYAPWKKLQEETTPPELFAVGLESRLSQVGDFWNTPAFGTARASDLAQHHQVQLPTTSSIR